MDIFTGFFDNYRGALEGLNLFTKIVITLALIFVFLAIVSAFVNVFLIAFN